MNHKEYTAIYPPLWQLAARGVVAVHDSVAAMKLFLVGLRAGRARRAGARCCAAAAQPRERLLVMAWSPLALVEIAGSGHNDVFAIAFLALSLLWLESGRPLPSARGGRARAPRRRCCRALVAASWARRYRAVHVLAAALSPWPSSCPIAGPGRACG